MDNQCKNSKILVDALLVVSLIMILILGYCIARVHLKLVTAESSLITKIENLKGEQYKEEKRFERFKYRYNKDKGDTCQKN